MPFRAWECKGKTALAMDFFLLFCFLSDLDLLVGDDNETTKETDRQCGASRKQ
jgi:hypothetical protein